MSVEDVRPKTPIKGKIDADASDTSAFDSALRSIVLTFLIFAWHLIKLPWISFSNF